MSVIAPKMKQGMGVARMMHNARIVRNRNLILTGVSAPLAVINAKERNPVRTALWGTATCFGIKNLVESMRFIKTIRPAHNLIMLRYLKMKLNNVMD